VLATSLLVTIGLGVIWSCGRQDIPAGDGPTPDAISGADVLSRTTEEGPIRATVALEPAEPRLGDRLTLTLSVEAEAHVVVEMPAFGEALGRFSIVDFAPRRETDPEGRTLASQRYTLQAPMSGKQRIPPLRIEFLDERPGQTSGGEPDQYRELLTEELMVEIASVLPEGAVTDELRPVRAELAELSSGRLARNWAIGLVIAGGAVALIAAAAWWRRRAAERARITAYDRAMRRIRILERQGLPSPDEADAWYVELSDIVRHYLEDRYGVRAPELTTEEFLQEAKRSPELSASHRELLSSFLERCDRVKFAAYRPEESESKSVIEAARRFLDETRVIEKPHDEMAEKPAA
jgi:hypothetical protein